MKNKTQIICAAAITLAATVQLNAQVIDSWDFSNGTGISDTQSNNGSVFGGANGPSSINSGALDVTATNTVAVPVGNESIFRTTVTNDDWGTNPVSSGIIEYSWTVTNSSFAITDGVAGANANAGFSLRQTTGGNVSIADLRLRYESGAGATAGNYVLQSRTENETSWTDNEVNFAAGTSISDLDLRAVINFDDNLSISTVPEPSAYALLSGICALGFVMVRRRK